MSKVGLFKSQVLSEDESDIKRLTGAEKRLNIDLFPRGNECFSG